MVRFAPMRGEVTAQCGHCDYDVRGLPEPICPECGSDLRIIGVKTVREPPLRDFAGLAFYFLLGGILIVPLTAGAVSGVGFAFLGLLLDDLSDEVKTIVVLAGLAVTVVAYLFALYLIWLGWKASRREVRRRAFRQHLDSHSDAKQA